MLKMRTQGIRGKDMSYYKEVGFVESCPESNENRILIDDYEGSGKDYHQRQVPKITIMQAHNIVFEGNFSDLVKALNYYNIHGV